MIQPSPLRYSPYQGLIPFTEKDSEFFFGREKEIRLIIANLFASPLTLLYGPSGVGKSSVLRAGVINQLNQRSELKVIFHSAWKDDPLAKLRAVAASLSTPGKQSDPNRSLAELFADCSSHLNKRLMIVLDQFEEYFLYHPRNDNFESQFSKAVMQTDIPISFLISIREDTLARLDRFEGRIPILFDNYIRLEHLNEAAARSAIESPIAKYNQLFLADQEQIQIEPALVDEVVRQLKTGRIAMGKAGLGVVHATTSRPIETPYLQLVMTRLWESENLSQSRLLRLSTLNKLGGAEKIVHTHLDNVMHGLTNAERSLAARIFQFLVTPSGTKIVHKTSDLASYVKAPPARVQSLLGQLTEQHRRLLRAVDTTETNDPSYEIFHDVLASPMLAWSQASRTQDRRWRRIRLTAVIFFLASLVWCGSIFAIMYYGGDQLQSDFNMGVLEIFLTSLLCTIPSVIFSAFLFAIGFFAGRSWMRAE